MRVAWAVRAGEGHRTIRHLPLLLFLSGLLAYGASFAWYMLHRFDLVNVIGTYIDDAFYYFQIARNLAEGQFSTFDGGITRTNGYHPLWMVLITPLWWVFDPDGALFAVKVFEIMLVAGAVALIVVAARLARVYWVLLFAALPMLYRTEGLLWGLEAAAGLFMLGLLFLALGLYAREPGRWRWLLAVVAFLMPWVRLEYAAISVAATGALCFIEWSWRDGAPGRVPSGGVRSMSSLAAFTPLLGACAGVLVYFAWNGVVFGGIVPVSGAVKQLISQAYWERAGGYSFVRNFQEVMDRRPFFGRELLESLEICAWFLLVWWFGRRSRRPDDRLFLVFLAGAFALSAGHVAKFTHGVLTTDYHYLATNKWHYVPAYLMAALIVPVRCYVAIYFIRRFAARRSGRFRVADVSSIFLVADAAFVLVERTEFSWPYKYVDYVAGISRINSEQSSYANALLMNRILPEGSIIGSWDSGIMGYYSGFPVVNLDGLVNSYEYLQEAHDRRILKRMSTVLNRDRDNAEYLRRTFGITHFANLTTAATAEHIENVYSETAPFLPLHPPHPYASVLWSEDPPGTSYDGVGRASRFREWMEPHFDAEADGVGAVFDGRLVQIFAGECEGGEGKPKPSLILLLDGEGRISGVSNPWENRWTTARGRRPGSCIDTILLPRDTVRPVRMEVLSEGGDVSRLFGADRRVVRSGGYDVYLHKKQLVYVNRQCDDDADTSPLFFVHVTPVDDSDLPVGQQRHGVENLDFAFDDFGRRMGNTCIAVRALPGYDIARVRTGQHVRGARLWDAEIRLDVDAGWIAGVVERAEPAIRADFDVYHDGDRLLYTGAECGDADIAPPFFLHVFPEDEGDLPAGHREHGFHHLDFRFKVHRLPLDLYFKDAPAPGGMGCAAVVDLPGYEVARIRTGQYVPGGPVLWEGGIRLDVDTGWSNAPSR